MGSRVGANDYRVNIGPKTKTYHMNMLKKFIARELEVDVVLKSNKDYATVAVAGVIHQDTSTDPEVEGYLQKEGVQGVKLSEDLSEDQ